MLGESEWQALSPELRRQLTGRTLGDLFGDARSALEAGSFEGAAHVVRMLLDLDEEGWAAMTELAEAPRSARPCACKRKSVNRRSGRDGATEDRAGTIGLLVFQR